MNIQAVKKELRELKSTVHIIDTLKNTQIRYNERIEALLRLPKTKRIEEQISNLKRVLSLMRLDAYIEKATALEKKYIVAINKLDNIEKTLILDTFINGISYWKIGLNLGYAEETVRKKVSRAIRKLSTLL